MTTSDTTVLALPNVNDGLSSRLTIIAMLLFTVVALQGVAGLAAMSAKAQRWEYAIEAPVDEELGQRLATRY